MQSWLAIISGLPFLGELNHPLVYRVGHQSLRLRKYFDTLKARIHLIFLSYSVYDPYTTTNASPQNGITTASTIGFLIVRDR